MPTTIGEKRVLQRLEQDAELVQAIPGGWWLDNEYISGKIGWSLLRKMLIRESQDSTKELHRYFLPKIGE